MQNQSKPVEATAYYPQNDAGMAAQLNNMYTQFGAYENEAVEASMFENVDTEVAAYMRDLSATSNMEFSPDDDNRD